MKRNYALEDRITMFLAWILAYALAWMWDYSYITLVSIALIYPIFTLGWVISNLVNGDVWHLGMHD